MNPSVMSKVFETKITSLHANHCNIAVIVNGDGIAYKDREGSSTVIK